MKKISFILFFFFAISACKKEDVPTFGQQAATKIQAETQKAGATVATVFIGAGQVIGEDRNFSFEGEFVVVGPSRYNLNKLVRYRINNSQGVQTLILYF